MERKGAIRSLAPCEKASGRKRGGLLFRIVYAYWRQILVRITSIDILYACNEALRVPSSSRSSCSCIRDPYPTCSATLLQPLALFFFLSSIHSILSSGISL